MIMNYLLKNKKNEFKDKDIQLLNKLNYYVFNIIYI